MKSRPVSQYFILLFSRCLPVPWPSTTNLVPNTEISYQQPMGISRAFSFPTSQFSFLTRKLILSVVPPTIFRSPAIVSTLIVSMLISSPGTLSMYLANNDLHRVSRRFLALLCLTQSCLHLWRFHPFTGPVHQISHSSRAI